MRGYLLTFAVKTKGNCPLLVLDFQLPRILLWRAFQKRDGLTHRHPPPQHHRPQCEGLDVQSPGFGGRGRRQSIQHTGQGEPASLAVRDNNGRCRRQTCQPDYFAPSFLSAFFLLCLSVCLTDWSVCPSVSVTVFSPLAPPSSVSSLSVCRTVGLSLSHSINALFP